MHYQKYLFRVGVPFSAKPAFIPKPKFSSKMDIWHYCGPLAELSSTYLVQGSSV